MADDEVHCVKKWFLNEDKLLKAMHRFCYVYVQAAFLLLRPHTDTILSHLLSSHVRCNPFSSATESAWGHTKMHSTP